MSVQSVAPDPSLGQILPGSQFADAYSLTIGGAGLTARAAAERILGHSPWWVRALMALRDRLVAPLGLKTADEASHAERIGIFPILAETPDRLVAGFDDSHLDFRILIDVSPVGDRQRITATTVVLTHNGLGRAYLAVILPFHRLIVRSMLKQAG